MRRLPLGALLLVGALCACDDADQCKELCNSLRVCGLLPSPLGVADNVTGTAALDSAYDDCATRCSSSDQRQTLYLDAFTSAVSSGNGWCHEPDLDGGIDLTSSPCSALSHNVELTYGTAALGRATLIIVPHVGDPALAPAQATDCHNDPVIETGGDTTGVSEADANAICDTLGTSSAAFFYEREGQRVEQPKTFCSFELMFGSSSAQVAPGPFTAGIKLIGESYDPNPGACWVFYAQRSILHAGAGDSILRINIPNVSQGNFALIPCEDDLKTCGDHVDDDQDGLTDCADVECSSLAQQDPSAGYCYGNLDGGEAGAAGCSGDGC